MHHSTGRHRIIKELNLRVKPFKKTTTTKKKKKKKKKQKKKKKKKKKKKTEPCVYRSISCNIHALTTIIYIIV